MISISFTQLVLEVWRLKDLTGKSKCKRRRPEALRRGSTEEAGGRLGLREHRRGRAWPSSLGMGLLSWELQKVLKGFEQGTFTVTFALKTSPRLFCRDQIVAKADAGRPPRSRGSGLWSQDKAEVKERGENSRRGR